MNYKINGILLIAMHLLSLVACNTINSIEPLPNEEACKTPIIDKGYYYTIEDREYLWGGEDSASHFDITGWSLDACHLKNGVGRETFHALLNPEFVTVENEKETYSSDDRVLILRGTDSVKIYPINLLREHETLNDQIDGINVIVVYCFVAELTAVYTTNYCGKDLTFAVSGYTYIDPDLGETLESFVLWDRETESLWWPIIEQGVSGHFQSVPMVKYKEHTWEETTWGDIITNYPNAYVLKRNQTMDTPKNWPKVYPCN